MQVKVRTMFGRNFGKVGEVKKETETDYYVEFDNTFMVNEGFGSSALYPDAYWVKKERCEVVNDRN
jgi:hypothetical protein